MAGSSTLNAGGWTANPTPDTRFSRTISIPSVTGQPVAEIGAPGDLAIDVVARKLYENVAGVWSAGTAY